MIKMKKLFVLKNKPGKTYFFSFLLTIFALLITWSTVSIIVKIDSKKDAIQQNLQLDK